METRAAGCEGCGPLASGRAPRTTAFGREVPTGCEALQNCGFSFFDVSEAKIRCKHAILYRAKARFADFVLLVIRVTWENAAACPT